MFIESKVWNGLSGADMNEVFSLIGPSITKSKRRSDMNKAVKKEYTQQFRDKIKFFNNVKGYGKTSGGTFLHVSRFVKNQGSFARHGLMVAYDIEVDKRSEREIAVNIEIVTEG